MRHRSGSVARLLTVVILLTAWVATAWAQTQGGISGLVTDSSGGAIPGATVTVTNTATGGTRNTTTNAEGLYTFPSLPPGNYELKVELQGFKTAEVSAFKVDVQQTVRRDVALEVGALQETVTVSGVPEGPTVSLVRAAMPVTEATRTPVSPAFAGPASVVTELPK